MYYPPYAQQPYSGAWPNMYPYSTAQGSAMPVMYYQTPAVPAAVSAISTSEAVIQQPAPAVSSSTTMTKTMTSRILDPNTLPTIGSNSVIEETTTTVTRPDVRVEPTSVAQVTTIIRTPSPDRTTIYRVTRRASTLSTSTFTSSTSDETSTAAPTPHVLVPPAVVPVVATVPTTTVVPTRRIIHRPVRAPRVPSPSGYISSDLDHGKQKVYTTDYKYRHYYCCNLCQGRCDLHNRSYSCCEWFYGCPVWAYLLLALFFLALLVGFFTLLGLQPSLNSARRTQTVQTRLLNRTQVIYGFYRICGFQANVSNTPTTLILCTNTPTTTTARIELSSFYTIVNGTERVDGNVGCLFGAFFLLLFSLRLLN